MQLVISLGVKPTASPHPQCMTFLFLFSVEFLFLLVFSARWTAKVAPVDQAPDR